MRLLFALIALLAGSIAPAAAQASTPPSPGAGPSTGPTAQQLLAKLGDCHPVNHQLLKRDEDSTPDVAACGMHGAVYLKADLDVDCDGRRTAACNEDTDCCFQNRTTFPQSDGTPLNAAELPYFVLPRAGSNWDWHDQGIDGGSVAAIIYDGRVTYAVLGDTDSPDKAGEASYATAKSLGIDPNPRSGGVDDGVTYIVFSNATATPIESHDAAVSVGEQAARAFLAAN